MKPGAVSALPLDATASDRIEADLVLLHPPSVFDFRERDDLLLPFLGESSSVNVTPVFEQYPLGFLAIRARLAAAGLRVRIVNLASLMLAHPGLDVRKLLERLHAPVFGLDLHWLCHAHGVEAVSRLIKSVHPDCFVICGGISATYYAREVLAWPAVDAVLRGYDTLEPLARLVAERAAGRLPLASIPNLVWRAPDGSLRDNGFEHRPAQRLNDVAIDWSFYDDAPEALSARSIQTLPSAGCGFDCPWCGGSRSAMQRVMAAPRPLVQREMERIVEELRGLGDAASRTGIYALQCYSEGPARMRAYLEAVRDAGVGSVHFEQFHLPDVRTMRRMAAACRAYIVLSPESHDPVVSRLAGRGTYTTEELIEWIPVALDAGIRAVFVWYFVGMPRQDEASVMATAEVCGELMERFPGGRVVPLICPMAPFLDPGSTFFEEPQAHGYRVLRRSLEQHRLALTEPAWHMRLNYETRWLDRKAIERVSFRAVRRLLELKGDHGVLPPATVSRAIESIDETVDLMRCVSETWEATGGVPEGLRARIRAYNARMLASSHDQILPMRRPVRGRWFDDHTVPSAWMEALCT